MKIACFAAAIALLTSCSEPAQPIAEPNSSTTIKLLEPSGQLNADTLLKGLSLTNPEQLQSGRGTKKHRWNIVGIDPAQASLEVIGNNQQDADLLGGHCTEYSPQGNAVFPWTEQGACRRLLLGILANTVNRPDELTTAIIAAAVAAAPTAAVHSFQDINVELASDGFFFLRKPSRNP